MHVWSHVCTYALLYFKQECMCACMYVGMHVYVLVYVSSLWVSRTGSASHWWALQEALYKCIDTIQ